MNRAPNPDADPAMAQYARRLLEADVAAKGSGLSGEVRRLVLTQLGHGRCTIDRIAQFLGVDRRTVHRRLACEGRTFSAIVAEVRREFAVRYMKESHRTLAEVSSLLGFAAPSGFSRWYRREFGTAASRGRGLPGRKAR
jgi:AraC-like DNA-binding protein